MVWDDSLATGVELVDNQHKEIIRRVNKLVSSVQGTEEVVFSETEQLLDFLADYVIVHFRFEEELMGEVSYPGHDTHKRQHDGFVGRFIGMRDEFNRTGMNVGSIEELIDMTSAWLIEHIAGSDAEFAAYYRIETDKA